VSRPPEPLKVIDVRTLDPGSGESTVEFETKRGHRFTCFAFRVEFQPGEEVTNAEFSLLDREEEFEEVFAGNQDRKMCIENTASGVAGRGVGSWP